MPEQVITFKTAIKQPSGIQDVDPSEVRKLANSIELIDVRQSEEYIGELGHISGAKLIPLDELEDALSGLDPSRTYVFVCRSGARSGRATAMAQSMGIASSFNMSGGMILWNKLNYEVERD